jgi:hypothetical protein
VNQEQRMAQHNLGEKKKTAKELFEQAAARYIYKQESEGDLRTILAGTQQAMQWLQDYVFTVWNPKKKEESSTNQWRQGSTHGGG